MRDLTVNDFINVTGAELVCGNKDDILGEFKKDTREIKNGDTYVGIKGEKIDGSLLFERAFECGAKVCIIENIEIFDDVIRKWERKDYFES